MHDVNLHYLSSNYYTLEEVCKQSGLSEVEIMEGIRDKFFPGPSYTVTKRIDISSPLGDSHSSSETILFFPHAYVGLVTRSRTHVSDNLKNGFIAEMKEHLLSHADKEFAYGGRLDDESHLNAELEKEWDYYCEGIYGICTPNATPHEIIEKEIAIKKLIVFLNASEEVTGREEELLRLIENFDRVSNLFAPYQREASSRGKYVDRSLRAIGRVDRIKTY